MPETLVVDCSVAASWILPEPGRGQALRWLEQGESGEVSLIAPDLLLAEFASLIAKRTRRKQISAAQAFRLMEQSIVHLFETRSLLGTALELALHNQMSLWDCVYLALALERDCPLITADRRLFRASRGRHTAIRHLD
jgi:predicted nucleic acid-binding protein